MATLNPKDAAIAELWDGGQSIEEIAGDTGLSTGRIRAIVGNARVTDGEYARRRQNMARGSALLLAAILKALTVRESA
jgi:hypothetical protein